MSKSEPLFVSLVMPVRNEAAFVGRSLASVLAQDYPMSQMRVLVAEGRSEARAVEFTWLMVEMWRKAVLETHRW